MSEKKNDERLVKCRYSHCKFPGVLKPSSEMVKNGKTTYYHPQCFAEKEAIGKIVNYYIENVDSRATIAQLRNVINNIVFKKGVPAEELLFDLTYAHKTGGKINSPYTLHYIITNKKIQREYKKHLESIAKKVDTTVAEVKEDVDIKHSTKKVNGFESIF